MVRTERKRSEKIGATGHAALKAELLTRGLSPAQAVAAIGAAHGNRTRGQVAEALRAWLRSRPKGG